MNLVGQSTIQPQVLMPRVFGVRAVVLVLALGAVVVLVVVLVVLVVMVVLEVVVGMLSVSSVHPALTVERVVVVVSGIIRP